jgi:hypothetical protein
MKSYYLFIPVVVRKTSIFLLNVYQHEFILVHLRKWNPNPFGRDIQLRDFTSFW